MTTQWHSHDTQLPPANTQVLVHVGGEIYTGKVVAQGDCVRLLRSGGYTMSQVLEAGDTPWWWAYQPPAPEGAPPPPTTWIRKQITLELSEETTVAENDAAMEALGLQRVQHSFYATDYGQQPIKVPNLDTVLFDGQCRLVYQSWEEVVSDPVTSPTIRDALLWVDETMIKHDFAHHCFLESFSLRQPSDESDELPRIVCGMGS